MPTVATIAEARQNQVLSNIRFVRLRVRANTTSARRQSACAHDVLIQAEPAYWEATATESAEALKTWVP